MDLDFNERKKFLDVRATSDEGAKNKSLIKIKPEDIKHRNRKGHEYF